MWQICCTYREAAGYEYNGYHCDCSYGYSHETRQGGMIPPPVPENRHGLPETDPLP